MFINAAGKILPVCVPIAPKPYVKPTLKIHMPMIDRTKPYIVINLFGKLLFKIIKSTNIKNITNGRIARTPNIISTNGVWSNIDWSFVITVETFLADSMICSGEIEKETNKAKIKKLI